MATDIDQLVSRLGVLLQQLSPQQRVRMARDMARRLRASQAQRIKANVAPDGTAHAPRQPSIRTKPGGIRHQRMFQKIARTKWLKAKGTANEATVYFAGFAQTVAREHHYGLQSTVGPGQRVKMPERPLLGFTDAELKTLDDLLLRYLVSAP